MCRAATQRFVYSDIVLSVTLSCGAFLLGSGAVISYWLPDGSGKPRAHVLTNSGENTAVQSGCTLPAQQQWSRARREPWDSLPRPKSCVWARGCRSLPNYTRKNGWALNRYTGHVDMDLPFYLLFSALGRFHIVSICTILCAFEQHFIFYYLISLREAQASRAGIWSTVWNPYSPPFVRWCFFKCSARQ